MKHSQPRQTVYRKDYTPYPWRLERTDLNFSIHQGETVVTAELRFCSVDGKAGPLVLDGSNLELLEVALDGEKLEEGLYLLDEQHLTITDAPAECTVRTRVRIHPASNLALQGLYVSADFLLTQCEPEGFRTITFFPDRPDVMSRYNVTIEADQRAISGTAFKRQPGCAGRGG